MFKYLNKKEFEYNNIIAWHKAGYTGKGIKVANLESGNPNAWNLKGKVLDPFFLKRSGTNNHGDKVMDVLLQVAPDINIYMLSNAGKSVAGGGFEGTFTDVTLPFIEENDIHLVNASLTGTSNQGLADKVAKAKNKGTTFITSAGNESNYSPLGYSSENGWITISASHLDRNSNPSIANYSSRGESIDFTQFSGIYVNNQKDRDYRIYEEGTSFASPMFCGMLALVQDFFLANTGKTLNQEKLYEFALDNVVDLGDEGKDNLYGHGIFVLPNPGDIDINRYVAESIEPSPKDNNDKPTGDDIVDRFKDINKNAWYYEAVKWAIETGLMKGKSKDEFDPNAPLTRAEYCQAEYNKLHNK